MTKETTHDRTRTYADTTFDRRLSQIDTPHVLMKFRPSFVMLLAAACLGGSGALSGQTAVLDLTYGSTVDGADSSSSDLSYSN